MTLKEQLIKEIETTPISLLPEILHFVQSIKTKLPTEYQQRRLRSGE